MTDRSPLKREGYSRTTKVNRRAIRSRLRRPGAEILERRELLSADSSVMVQSVMAPAMPSNPAAINFSGLLPSSLQGWFYVGSLTAPPLSQPVNFLVLSTPITLSFAQLQQYEAIASASGFLPSARPIQPLDGRQVNQFNFDVNFENQSVARLNFGLARRV